MIRSRAASIGMLVMLLLAVGHRDVRAQFVRDGNADKAKASAERRHDEPVHPMSERTASVPVQGKAGIDRFEIDHGRVTESARVDGTVVVHLNGEGMEKMSLLDDGTGALRAVCASLLENESRRSSHTPADFRRLPVPQRERRHEER